MQWTRGPHRAEATACLDFRQPVDASRPELQRIVGCRSAQRRPFGPRRPCSWGLQCCDPRIVNLVARERRCWVPPPRDHSQHLRLGPGYHSLPPFGSENAGGPARRRAQARGSATLRSRGITNRTGLPAFTLTSMRVPRSSSCSRISSVSGSSMRRLIRRRSSRPELLGEVFLRHDVLHAG